MLVKIDNLDRMNSFISSFLAFVRKHRKQAPLYIKNPGVEGIYNKAEQHVPIIT